MINEVISDDNIKCSICKSYLSFSPVFVQKNGTSICGKCNEGKGKVTIRNLTYEALAKSCKFPCQFKSEGCKDIYLWEEVKEHENECPYREITCFNCKWKGNFTTLENHFKQVHPQLLLYLPTEIKPDITSNSDKKYLIPAMRNLFIVHVKYSVASSTFSCQTCFVGKLKNKSNFEYSLEVTPKHGNGQIKLTKSVQQTTDSYSPIELNLDSVQKQLLAEYEDCKFIFSIHTDSQYTFRKAILNTSVFQNSDRKEILNKCQHCFQEDTTKDISKHYYWFCPVSLKIRFCLECKELIERKSTFSHYLENHIFQDCVFNANKFWLKNIHINTYRIALCTAFDAMFLIIIQFCDKSKSFKCNIVSNLPKDCLDLFECMFQLCNPNTGYTSPRKQMVENETGNGEYDWKGVDTDDFEEYAWVVQDNRVKKVYNVQIIINRKDE